MKKQPIIIVEGKYDLNIIKKVTDSPVIQTNGFAIFNNKKLDDFIRRYAPETGIVILTDSDSAGLVIRKHIESLVDKKYIKNAYVPRIKGKEKRKSRPSKERILGVEGMSEDIIKKALQQAGIDTDIDQKDNKITKVDLYEDGLMGRPYSAEKRKRLFRLMELPDDLSSNRLLEIINASMTKERYKEMVNKIEEPTD